ncbi:MAG: hypothetical protein ABT940_00325 [Alphaproteobacteria bacterium]
MIEFFGGNQVRRLSSLNGYTDFANEPYRYGVIPLNNGGTWSGAVPASCTLFVVQADTGSRFDVASHDVTLTARDSMQIEGGSQVTVTARGGGGLILVSGTPEPHAAPSVTVTPGAEQYRVAKPWGHEIWINGEHPGYCLKEVHLKAGTRTSLQYHHFKRETNVLFVGHIRLIYKINETVANDDTGPEDLGAVELTPMSAIDVTPEVLHRIEALTDTTLYEVSTPHLDDVIRVSDDNARKHGRIAAEHKS